MSSFGDNSRTGDERQANNGAIVVDGAMESTTTTSSQKTNTSLVNVSSGTESQQRSSHSLFDDDNRKPNAVVCSKNATIDPMDDEKAVFKRAYDLIDRTLQTVRLPSHVSSSSSSILVDDNDDELPEPDLLFDSPQVDYTITSHIPSHGVARRAPTIHDTSSPYSKRNAGKRHGGPALTPGAEHITPELNSSNRSIPRDHYLQRVQQQPQPSEAHEDAYCIAHRTTAVTTFHRERLLAPTLVARAPSNKSDTLTHAISQDGKRRGSGPAFAPGAEHVQRRAPGLSPSLYLGLIRRDIAQRAQQAQEEAQMRDERQNDEEVVTHTEESPLESPHHAEPSRQVVTNVIIPPTPHPLLNNTVPLGEEQFVESDQRESKSLQNTRWRIAIAVIGILVTVACAIGIGLGLSKRNNSTTATNGSGDSGTKSVPLATTQFGLIAWDCSSLNSSSSPGVQPNVISQCHCDHKITIVADDIVARYNELAATFMTSLYPSFTESLDSCNVYNQALVWLASATGTPSLDVNLVQRYILALLFIMWSGQQWIVHDGWLSPDIECTWTGVSCDRMGLVTGINLYNNNGTGYLGSDFAHLTGLTALSLDQNVLQGSVPTQVGNLASLTSLILDTNQLTGTLPTELSRLSLLNELSVVDNKLHGTIPTWIGQMLNLQSLSLSNNTFSPHPIPTEIGLLTNLQTLVLADAMLTGTLPTQLFQLGNTLQTFYAGSNNLSGTIPGLVGELVAISKFYFVIPTLFCVLITSKALTIT
jgi:hypothetical protein